MSALSRDLISRLRLIYLNSATSSSSTLPDTTSYSRFFRCFTTDAAVVSGADDIRRIIDAKPGAMTPQSKRTGVIAVKCGMSARWDKWGARVPITVLWVDHNVVSQVKTTEKEGISAFQIGCGQKKAKHLTKPEVGHFRAQGVPLKRKLREFSVTEDALLPVGISISVQHFVLGQYVDVTGITRGHRFQVFKAKKMPGRMGGKQRTVKNVWIYKIDPARNMIWVRGQVPGAEGNFVFIKDAFYKKPDVSMLSFPTYFAAEDEDSSTLEPLIADLGEEDPFMAAD